MVYISGPVSGVIDCNEQAFKKAERILNRAGYKTINPVQECKDAGLTDWLECMELCLEKEKECNIIYMLKDWENSKGAKIEYKYAKEHDIKILELK
jgi:hypothetical protein